MPTRLSCGTWIRTKIPASKGPCPAIRRSRIVNSLSCFRRIVLPCRRLRSFCFGFAQHRRSRIVNSLSCFRRIVLPCRRLRSFCFGFAQHRRSRIVLTSTSYFTMECFYGIIWFVKIIGSVAQW